MAIAQRSTQEAAQKLSRVGTFARTSIDSSANKAQAVRETILARDGILGMGDEMRAFAAQANNTPLVAA